MPPTEARIPKAPYDRNGNLLSVHVDGCVERTNVPFRTPLRLDRRGGAYVIWRDPQGREYPMFMSELVDLLRTSSVSNGVTVGWWVVVKRGRNYGISRCVVDG